MYNTQLFWIIIILIVVTSLIVINSFDQIKELSHDVKAIAALWKNGHLF